jgi:hypothetical protein
MMRLSKPQMYFRPEQIFLWFTVEPLDGGLNTRGREVNKWQAADPLIRFQGIKADASPENIERYRQAQHPITHSISVQGAPQAVTGDRLKTDDNKYLYIQGIETPGGLNLWTIYQCEERPDKGGGPG